MEKEEDQKKGNKSLNLDWNVIFKDENGPPAEVVVVGGQAAADKIHIEIDFIKEATDHQLQEKIKRLEGLFSGQCLKLPDKGEKLFKSLKLHKEELERRNQIHLRKEAEGAKSRKSRSTCTPGACNCYGSEGPSHESKFFTSFLEHLDGNADLCTRISVDPVSKKLSIVDRDNHRGTSSKGVLGDNGRRETKASTTFSPSQRPRSSDRDGHEHRSSLGALKTIDSSFYRPSSDGTCSGRSSKRFTGACNSYGSVGPSHGSKFFTSVVEHLDGNADLRTRISVDPFSKKLSIVDCENHQSSSSQGVLLDNGRRENKASTTFSPSQHPRISDSDKHEHRSSLGAQKTIDLSSFYHPLFDGTFSGRSSKSCRMTSNNERQLYHCLCGGFCKVLVSHTKNNPDRLFITYPNKIGDNGGCGLWQWHDEVKLCQCGAGICRIKKCKTSKTPTNLGRRFYCCPRSSGCGFFAWLDAPDEDEKCSQTSVGSSSQMGELRKFVETKHSVTMEVCDSKDEKCSQISVGSSSQIGELRKFVETKRSVTMEVCDSILEKMKELNL